MSCCPPGSIGPRPLANKTPSGTTIKLTSKEGSTHKELPMYVVGVEESPSTVLVVFSDVFGVDSGNQKVLCDTLSERMESTLVVMPDLFRGNPILGGWGLPAAITDFFQILSVVWGCRTRITIAAIEKDLVEILLPYLNKYEGAKISMVGMCFGGWVMGRALALGEFSHIKCGVGIHPSWKLQVVYGEKEEALAEAVKDKPILFLVAKNDDLKVDTPIVQQLSKQRGGIDENKISIEFPDMIHGFVARGDASDPTIAEQQERALTLAIDFIKTEELK